MRHLKVYENFDEHDPFGEESDEINRGHIERYYPPNLTPMEIKILKYYDHGFDNMAPNYRQYDAFVRSMSDQFGIEKLEVIRILKNNRNH